MFACLFACDELTASLWRVDRVTSRPCDESTGWRVDLWRVDCVTSWPCDELTVDVRCFVSLVKSQLHGNSLIAIPQVALLVCMMQTNANGVSVTPVPGVAGVTLTVVCYVLRFYFNVVPTPQNSFFRVGRICGAGRIWLWSRDLGTVNLCPWPWPWEKSLGLGLGLVN